MGGTLDLKSAVSGALQRNSSAVSLMVLASLVLMVVSAAYFAAVFAPSQFENLPEVKEYDNALTSVTGMDEWGRTKFYWSNNLSVVGVMAAAVPTYLGTNAVLITSYQVGMAMVFNYNHFGWAAMLAFAGVIFVHGILELTAVFIVGGASLRLAWKLWEYLGRLIKAGLKIKLSRRSRAAAKRYAVDYILIVALAMFMIFLAAPVEAYFSPVMGVLFLFYPELAMFFIAAVLLFYVAIIKRGFAPMRREIASGWKEIKIISAGKWRPAHLSLLMLLIFSLMIWLGLF